MKKRTKPTNKPKPKTYRKLINGRSITYTYQLKNGRYIPIRQEAS